MKIIKNKSFKKITTFRIGGKIQYYTEVKSRDEVKKAMQFARNNSLPIFIIGDGSDFLANDNAYNGLVIKYLGKDLEFETKGSEVLVTAGAGLSWDKLVEKTVNKNLQGLECLSGIPGTVGASPIQNVGAYGVEMSDSFVKLDALDLGSEKDVVFSKDECKFGYRNSIFKDNNYWQRYLIYSVTFKLKKNAKPTINYESLRGLTNENTTLREVRDLVLKIRKEKLESPKKFGNAGSFFKNPIIDTGEKNRLQKIYPDAKIFPFGSKYKVSAAWLIEKCGWKGRILNGAAVSSKHSLMLINKSGKATSEDVYNLSEMIIKDVFEKTGIKLEREVQLINF